MRNQIIYLCNLKQNYVKDIKLHSMAEYLSVSPEYLSRLFKKSICYSFKAYVTLIRVQNEEYMLKNDPGKKIYEIAYDCGFNDENYFSYKFKEMYSVALINIKSKNGN